MQRRNASNSIGRLLVLDSEAGAWQSFTERLVSTFRGLSARSLLIISAREDQLRYVQFAGDNDRIYAEASGAYAHTPESASRLLAVGWTSPTIAAPNWSTTLRLPALTTEYTAFAEKNVLALASAFDVVSPDEVVYKAWREPEPFPRGVTLSDAQIAELDPGENPLLIPSLGLATQA